MPSNQPLCSSTRPRRDRLGLALLAAACVPGVTWAQPTPADPAPAVVSAPELPASAADAAAPQPTPALPPKPTPFRYQVGLAVSSAPNYAGASASSLSLRPVLSLQWGRLRLTSSKANLVEGPSDGSTGPGASVSLAETARWSSGLALRTDNGRSSSDDPRLAGIPEVRATLRARLYGRYSFDGTVDDSRAVGATLSTDLLGRGGGTTLSIDLSRRVLLSPAWRWSMGGGLGMADGVYLRSHHGVSPAASAVSGLPVYRPGAGLTDVHLGTGLTWRLHPRWRVGGTVSANYLLGPAADSPLTQRRLGLSLVVGAVYISPEP